MNAILKNLKKKKVWIPGVIVLVVIAFFVFRGGSTQKPETFEVKKVDLTQEVSVTGTVKPAANADLAFDRSGRVSYVGAKVGDMVGAGQTIVSLENGDLLGTLEEAQADVKSAQAKLDELKRGTRPEEITVQEVKVKSAETALDDAKNSLLDKLQDSYTKSDDAVRAKVDQLYVNPKSTSPRIKFQMSDSNLQSELESRRYLIEGLLNNWEGEAGLLNTSGSLNVYITDVKKNLQEVKSFIDRASVAVNGLVANSSLSQTTIDGWRTDIGTARANINTAITNLSTAEEKFRTADSSLSLAQQELELDRAGSTQEQIAAQEAQVERANAAARSAAANLGKTLIKAPIAGIVTKQDAKVGEIATAGTALVSMIGNSGFEIEANVPEADIAKINVGNKARVTLDAYGSDVYFDASVVKIDPAETVIDGVPTYKVTLQFSQKDERIKSGMTANTDVATNKKEGVLAVPQRAIITKDSKKYVRIPNAKNSYDEREVTTGLRGSDGLVEITGGLHEGDAILLDVKAVN